MPSDNVGVGLPAALRVLTRRCEALRSRLQEETRPECERLRRDALNELDAALEKLGPVEEFVGAAPADLRSVRRRYGFCFQVVEDLERLCHSVLRRFDDDDAAFTRLAVRFAAEIGLQIPDPVVTVAASRYFDTDVSHGIVSVPGSGEGSLLDLADLAHELAHVFLVEPLRPVRNDIASRIAGALGPDAGLILGLDVRAIMRWWHGQWLDELCADAVATFAIGPAYAWEHVRLSTAEQHPVMDVGTDRTHPANQARFDVITQTLERIGQSDDAPGLSDVWRELCDIAQPAYEGPSLKRYRAVHPQEAIDAVCDGMLSVCESHDLVPWSPDQHDTVAATLNEAWRRFLHSPDDFVAWEPSARVQLGLPSHGL